MTAAETMFDPSDQLDHVHIRAAANWAAEQLAETGRAVVRITPGDMTVYPILVTRPGPVWEKSRAIPGRSYLVALAADFGACYEWDGGDVHPAYAYEKWTNRDSTPGTRAWAAHVVAEFLTHLSEVDTLRELRL